MQYNGPFVLKRKPCNCQSICWTDLAILQREFNPLCSSKSTWQPFANNSQTFSFNVQTFGCHDSDEQELLCHDKSGELLKTQNHSSVVTSRHKEHGDAHFTALLAICGLINPSPASAAPLKIA